MGGSIGNYIRGRWEQRTRVVVDVGLSEWTISGAEGCESWLSLQPDTSDLMPAFRSVFRPHKMHA